MEQVDLAVQTVSPPSQAEGSSKMEELLHQRIKQLEAKESALQQMLASRGEESIYVSNLSSHHQLKLLNLIGKKCIINCLIDGVATKALWDTGSQICLINEEWRVSHLPHTTVHSMEEILGGGTLVGKAINQTPIPFIGWVEVKFQLGEEEASQPELLVPMLVSHDPGVAEEPIVGYNVIKQLLKIGWTTNCQSA